MSKKADTWMPVYVGEYLADTTNLNTEQHGAYWLMLMAAWKRGGSLPDDDGQLASITKLSAARWKAHRGVLVELFTESDGRLVHKRVTKERQKAQAISDKKAETGAEGASKRWLLDGTQIADALADAMPNAIANATLYAIEGGMANRMGNASQTDAPIPSPSPNTSEAEASVSAEKPPPAPNCPHLKLIDLFGKHLPELPQPKPELWDGKNAAAMRSRWKWVFSARKRNGDRYAATEAQALDFFDRFFGFVAQSDFLTGRSGRWSNCDLGWLMNQTNFAKVIQGNYQNRAAA